MKPANVTDGDVTDEAKALIYRGSCGEGKGAYRYRSARAGSPLRQRSGLSGMVNVEAVLCRPSENSNGRE